MPARQCGSPDPRSPAKQYRNPDPPSCMGRDPHPVMGLAALLGCSSCGCSSCVPRYGVFEGAGHVQIIHLGFDALSDCNLAWCVATSVASSGCSTMKPTPGMSQQSPQKGNAESPFHRTWHTLLTVPGVLSTRCSCCPRNACWANTFQETEGRANARFTHTSLRYQKTDRK